MWLLLSSEIQIISIWAVSHNSANHHPRTGAGMKPDDELAEAYNEALALEKAGKHDAAAKAYARVLELDPDDHGGAAVRLAAMGLGATPARASEAYVETLFDQHASVFDDILVDRLGYHVPMLVRSALLDHAPGPYTRMLDLGCGTGLAGVAVSDLTQHRTGIDLSANMVDLAAEHQLYDELYVGDAVSFVEEIEDEPWDLVVATDVLPYLGDVAALFSGVRRIAECNAVFAFSTEVLPDDVMAGQDFMVGPHQRFVHSLSYVETALTTAGLSPIHTSDITVRHEEGIPQPGHLVLARAI
jgi:predicted TPR repeat methyltransferase